MGEFKDEENLDFLYDCENTYELVFDTLKYHYFLLKIFIEKYPVTIFTDILIKSVKKKNIFI